MAVIVSSFNAKLLFVNLLICDLIFPTSPFNIDEEYPIVITNKFNGKEAHFGATVVLLSGLPESAGYHGEDSDSTTGWVLIGAPKANSTSANHLSMTEPGVIWRCALGNFNSSRKNLCEPVTMDPTGYYDPRDRNLPYHDKKDGAWLGGSMFVGESDRLVACASRWINQKFKELYLLNGICYWVPKANLAEESEGNRNWPGLAPKLSYRLMPLVDKSKQYYKGTASSTTVNAHLRNADINFDWAFGQFGFSLHLTPNNELISGTPGVFDWMGSLVYYRDAVQPSAQYRRYNAHPGSPVFSEVLVVRAQTLEENDILKNSDYFGYSVTSGNFFTANISKNRTQFAAGAPRASELSGKVLVFTLKEVMDPTRRFEARLEKLVEPLEGRDTTKGNHYGSYFGHSLLALDVNGDNFDDLLVSAPLYGTSVRYKRNAVHPAAAPLAVPENVTEASAKMKSGDEGCVFVYLSTGTEFLLRPQAICGDKVSGARFGMAISSLKDINFDGFNDFAVGAPYENEGRGAVYIYHGGEEFVTLAQKLEPKLISPLIRTFGWSLSLGVDIDQNGYPDLAVGAYGTNQVVIYRTLPIVDFTTRLTASIQKLLSSTLNFNITACINYSGRGGGVMPSVLGIWLKLTMEAEQTEGKRLVALLDPIDADAKLLNPNQNRSRRNTERRLLSYTRLVQIRSDGVDSCHNFSAVRVGSVDAPGIKSVPIKLDYWLNGYDRDFNHSKPIQYDIYSRSQLPVVNLSQSQSNFHQFSQKLPLPAGNMFGTDRLVIPVGTICEADGDPACLANLTITANLKNPATGQIYNASQPFVLGSVDTLFVEVELENHREVASLPVTLTMTWTQPPEVRRLPTTCEYSIGKKFLVCSIRKPIKENQKETVTLELNMQGVYAAGALEDSNKLSISFEATTSSELVKPARYNLVVPLESQLKPQDFSHQSAKIEYSVGNTSITTFGFTQAFEVGLGGPASAAALQVTFEIPTGFRMAGVDYQLIGVRKPVVTYDPVEKMRCEAVNGEFLRDVDFPAFASGSFGFRPGDNEDVLIEEDYSIDNYTGAARIIQKQISRMKRSIWMDSAEEQAHFSGILKIHCDPMQKSTVDTSCLKVICTAYDFTPLKKAVVEFKLRMVNKVAAKLVNLENYKGMKEIMDLDRIAGLWIESLGVVKTLSGNGKAFGDTGRLEFTSRLQIPPPYELPAWILIAAVGSGLLVFTVVTIVLKKCGFFKRSKRDELIKRKVEQLERSRLIASEPNTPSTARLRTNSSTSSSHHYGNSDKEYMYPANSSMVTSAGGSVLAMSISSPGTSVKQRDIPGAVDLNELRRLYDYAHEEDQKYY